MTNSEKNRIIAKFMGLNLGWVERYIDEGDEYNYKYVMHPRPFIYKNENIEKIKEENTIRKYTSTYDGMVIMEERLDLDYDHLIDYDKDWNRLMEVVERIEDLPYDKHHGHFGVHISSNGCDIQGTLIHLAFENLEEYGWVYMSDPNAILNTKKESTYYNVFEFIKWYNADYIPNL